MWQLAAALYRSDKHKQRAHSIQAGKCHEDQSRHYQTSAHGIAASAGNQAPTCVACHGGHSILPADQKGSPLFKTDQSKLCLKCHLSNPDIQKRVGYSAGFIGGYENSVHGKALASGNLKSATCADCHGPHDQKGAGNPSSLVNKQNIAQTCSRCHREIAREYRESVHGMARQNGKADAPTCTDCHGEHEILSRKDPRSLVAPKNVSQQVCGNCHNSVRLSAKYGLAPEQFSSFQDSYHGLAGRAGSVEVANCASCHGAHNIKRAADPKSAINKSNGRGTPIGAGTDRSGESAEEKVSMYREVLTAYAVGIPIRSHGSGHTEPRP